MLNQQNNATVAIQSAGTVEFNNLRGVVVTDNPNKNDSYVFNDCSGQVNANGTSTKPAKDSDVIKINNTTAGNGFFVLGNIADRVYKNGVKQPASEYAF